MFYVASRSRDQDGRYAECTMPSPDRPADVVPLDESAALPPHIGISVAEAPLSSLMLRLVRAHAAIATAMLQQIGLVAPQELVLPFLQENGRTPQSEIVYFLGRDRSSVTNTLQAMERAGLITRTRSQTDKRSMVVNLASKGRRLCPRIHEICRCNLWSSSPAPGPDGWGKRSANHGHAAFDSDGRLRNPHAANTAAAALLRRLVWWGRALHTARATQPHPA